MTKTESGKIDEKGTLYATRLTGSGQADEVVTYGRGVRGSKSSYRRSTPPFSIPFLADAPS